MATTEILLLKPVASLGSEGDIVTVKAGYARNFLFPRAFAVFVTESNRKQIEALKLKRLAREKLEKEDAQKLAEKLKTLSIAFVVKTGENGRLFGSISANDLIQRLQREGIILKKRQLNFENPVKELGRHSVEIKLHSEINAEFSFEVVSENPVV